MNQRTKEILEQMKKQRALDKLRKQQKQYAIDGKINTAKNVANNLPKAINYGQKAVDTLKTFKAPAASPTALTNSIKAATSANGLTSGLGSASAISDATKAATSVGNTASNLASTGSAISDATKAATTVGNAGSTASSAAGALQGVGKAMPVVGAALGGLSAANNFSKGNHVDGALDLAKTGAMFIPGVGWAVAGAIQVGQMIKDAINKKKQKNLQKNMQRMAENQQVANEKKQEAIESFGDNSLAVNTMPQQNMLGGSTSPVDTLDGQILPTEETTSLPEAPVSAEELGQPTGGAAGLGDISSILNEENTQGTFKGNMPFGGHLNTLEEKSPIDLSGLGQTTSGSILNAIDNFAGTDLEGTVGNMTPGAMALDASPINRRDSQGEIVNQGYKGALPKFNTPAQKPNTGSTEWGQNVLDAMNEAKGLGVDQNVIDAMPQGLNSGNADIAALIDKYTINKPTNAEDVELARQGKFNTPEQPIVTSEGVAIEPSKKDALIAEMMGKFKGGVNNFVRGYQDNANTSFSEGDLAKGLTGAAASAEPKTFLNRLGEAVGTGSRMIANPGLQGLVAGAIKGANTGDWGTGLEYGVNWAANKAKSDNYYKRINPNAKRAPIFSNYDSKDYNAHTLDNYRTLNASKNMQSAKTIADMLKAQGLMDEEAAAKFIEDNGADTLLPVKMVTDLFNVKNNTEKVDIYGRDVDSKITDRENKHGENVRHNKASEDIGRTNAGANVSRAGSYGKKVDYDTSDDDTDYTPGQKSKYPEGTIAQDKNGKKIIWRNGRWQDM